MIVYVVYILTNKFHGTLYIGVTNNLKRRMMEHREEKVAGFTKKYGLKKLVHVDRFDSIIDAIEREKQLKRWHRDWKINLIERRNPYWDDLYTQIFGPACGGR